MQPRQGGFTLLEIVVVLAVLGFLMVGITQGVRVGVSMWHAQSRRIDRTAELDAAQRILRELLTAIPLPPNDAGEGVNSGSATAFNFIGEMPTGLGATRRSDITLFQQGGRLMLSWRPHVHATLIGPSPPEGRVELVGGLVQLQISYFGPAAADSPDGWLAQWSGPAPPKLIRVRLTFAKDDPRRWPDLVVASQL